AIPTYNGATRLPQVLDKLKLQTGIEQLNWEILVVDNNSSDSTAEVVKEYQENWANSIPLRYCFESQQGLAFARQKAVEAAKGKYVGFLDDDNLPTPNWIQAAFIFGENHPQAGACSGQIHGDFEVEPPQNFEQIQQFLAIRELGYKAYLFEPDKLRLPPGAGLVIRKQAWIESVPNRLSLIGRVGNTLVAGEDYELLLYMHKSGWQIWYNPEMQIDHQIPRQRLERSYLLNLARGTGLATFSLRIINASTWQKPFIFVRTCLGNLRRLLIYFLKYKGNLQTELVPAFQKEFFWGSFLSVFYPLPRLLRKPSKV
ncbi:MAG: hormogonium polysaccharide biosynthesis glycosyltransferase HpsE, partial [Spirulinaceae cyanobacterium]